MLPTEAWKQKDSHTPFGMVWGFILLFTICLSLKRSLSSLLLKAWLGTNTTDREDHLSHGTHHLWEENNRAKPEVPVLARRWQRSKATLYTSFCVSLAKTRIQTKERQQNPASPSIFRNKKMKPLITYLLVFILIAHLPEIWLYEIMHAHQADEFP